jgi:hypothetical protein
MVVQCVGLVQIQSSSVGNEQTNKSDLQIQHGGVKCDTAVLCGYVYNYINPFEDEARLNVI